MSRARVNIMRAIRIQLKTGFLQTEPEEYTFMKRYPPMVRETKEPFHKLKTEKIPYLNLLGKNKRRNPLYDERVHPAYWQNEPIGLTLAKKQFQFMQKGDDEETAFKKAEEYVNGLENKAYLAMRELRDALKKSGAQAPFLKDEAVADELMVWREKLKHTSYEELDDAEQGEIDHLIQTKVMKWNEVERERRMRDPIFVKQFIKIRDLLLMDKIQTRSEEERRQEAIARVNEQVLAKAGFEGVDTTQMSAIEPFYLQDYVKFFNLFLEEPDEQKWRFSERSALDTWIRDCVALQGVIDGIESEKEEQLAEAKEAWEERLKEHKEVEGKPESDDYWAMQAYMSDVDEQERDHKNLLNAIEDEAAEQLEDYIEQLKTQFFPMRLNHADKAAYKPLAVNDLRAVLYHNGVGYKQEQGKVYVRRFYRLPALLFPAETIASMYFIDDIKALSELLDPRNEDVFRTEIMSKLPAAKDAAATEQNEALYQAVKTRLLQYIYVNADEMLVESDSDEESSSDVDAAEGEGSTQPVDERSAMETVAADAILDQGDKLGLLERRRARLQAEAQERATATTDGKPAEGANETGEAYRGTEFFSSDDEQVKKVDETVGNEIDAELMALVAEAELPSSDTEVEEGHLHEVSALGRKLKTLRALRKLNKGQSVGSSASTSDSGVQVAAEHSDADNTPALRRRLAAHMAFPERGAQEIEEGVLDVPESKTLLDKKRDAYFGPNAELGRRERIIRECQERVRLETEYERKEAARLVKDWEARKIWDMPQPHVPVSGLADV